MKAYSWPTAASYSGLQYTWWLKETMYLNYRKKSFVCWAYNRPTSLFWMRIRKRATNIALKLFCTQIADEGIWGTSNLSYLFSVFSLKPHFTQKVHGYVLSNNADWYLLSYDNFLWNVFHNHVFYEELIRQVLLLKCVKLEVDAGISYSWVDSSVNKNQNPEFFSMW